MNLVGPKAAASPRLLRSYVVAYHGPKNSSMVETIQEWGSFNAALSAVTAAPKNSVPDSSQ